MRNWFSRRRKRTTDEQRRLATQWLARTGREMTPAAVEELALHVRVTGRPELAEMAAFARLVRLGQVPTQGPCAGRWCRWPPVPARRQALEQAKAAVLDDLEGTGWPREITEPTGRQHGHLDDQAVPAASRPTIPV